MKLQDEISLIITKDEALFLSWCFQFIEGGPIGDENENKRRLMESKIGQIIKDMEKGFIKNENIQEKFVECAFCNGGGIFPDIINSDEKINYPCPVCEGIGFNCIDINSKNIIKCRFCGGEGKAWDSSGYPTGDVCEVCSGLGYINLNLLPEGDESLEALKLLHPEIKKLAEGRLKAKQYSDAVEAAFKLINQNIKKIVKEKIGEEIDGSALMNRAFSLKDPIILLADITTESGRNEQLGYMQLFSGAMTGLRNPKAHENQEILLNDAVFQLNFASMLLYTLEKRNS